MPFFSNLVLILPVLLSAVSSASADSQCPPIHRPNKCLPRLQTNPEDFSRCRDPHSPCFIFINQIPFIQLPISPFNASAVGGPLQRPYPCFSPQFLPPSLRESGVFRILQQLRKQLKRPHLRCVWAGIPTTDKNFTSGCSLDQLVDMVSHQTEYNFIIVNFMFSERTCGLLRSEVDLVDQLIVLTPKSRSTFGNPFVFLARFYSSLPPWSVLFILLLLVIVVLGFFWNNARLGGPWWDALGVYHRGTTYSQGTQNRTEAIGTEVCRNFSKQAAAGFLLLLLALLCITNPFWTKKQPTIDTRLEQLDSTAVGNFYLVGLEAVEYKFSYIVTGQAVMEYENIAEIPWKRCSDPVQCFKRLLNDNGSNSGSPLYFVTTEYVARALFKMFGHSSIAVVKTPNQEMLSGGWRYSPLIAELVRQELEDGLRVSEVRMPSKDRFLLGDLDDIDLKPKDGPIDMDFVSFLFLVLVVLTVLLLFLYGFKLRALKSLACRAE